MPGLIEIFMGASVGRQNEVQKNILIVTTNDGNSKVKGDISKLN
jgi:hypothetical protein